MSLYLDIETGYDDRITIIGFYSKFTGMVQLIQPQPKELCKALPETEKLFTFNGHAFDLPRIRRDLGLHLREWYECHDLMHWCHRANWYGGQKRIEQRLGLRRESVGLDGRDAQELWYRYETSGNEGALKELLQYNREDVMNMAPIRAALRRLGIGC
jgi:uncharacterized protein YprB with RNaseH-like and TPR domain